MCRCEAGGPRLRVALLLSGGVDSSLALRLVSAAGHAVTAFYLQIWFQEDYANFWDACPWEDDLAVCQQVCSASATLLLTASHIDSHAPNCLWCLWLCRLHLAAAALCYVAAYVGAHGRNASLSHFLPAQLENGQCNRSCMRERCCNAQREAV